MTEKSFLEKSKWFILAIGILLSLFILIGNIKRSLNFGLPTYDYGIYQQAIFEIAHQKKLNPFMSVRDEYVFNDHFMPILLMAVPGAWLTNYANWYLTSFEWLWYVTFLVVFFYLIKDLPIHDQIPAMVGAIFCKGWLFALHFTAHPGPWSGVIWLFLIYSLIRGNDTLTVVSACGLILFRESYVFSIFTLSIFFLIFRKKKPGFQLLLFSLIYMFFLFFARKHLVGPSFNYAARLLQPFINSPIEGLITHIKNFQFKVFFKLTLPYLIPLYFTIKISLKNRNHNFLAVLFLMAPYYGMHFLANKFNYQYGMAATVPFLAFFVFSETFSQIHKKNRFLYYLGIILLILNGTGYQQRFIKYSLDRNNDLNYINKNHRLELPSLINSINKIPKDKHIISTSNLTATMLKPGMINIHTVEEFMKKPQYFDYLLYPKYKKHPSIPLNETKHSYMSKFCADMIESIHYESNNFFLAKGKFTKDCYMKNYY